MHKKYISYDVEASGRTPGKYSMLSLGACIVRNREIQFYREIKPISMNYILPSMRVASLGLECLEKYRKSDELNPLHLHFNPSKVLEILSEQGVEPKKAMSDYADWVIENTKGFQPVDAAGPIKFDGMFTTWYFDNFYEGEDPFGHSGEDINSMYRGYMKNRGAHVAELGVRKEDLSHHALKDALVQAEEFEAFLNKIK